MMYSFVDREQDDVTFDGGLIKTSSTAGCSLTPEAAVSLAATLTYWAMGQLIASRRVIGGDES